MASSHQPASPGDLPNTKIGDLLAPVVKLAPTLYVVSALSDRLNTDFTNLDPNPELAQLIYAEMRPTVTLRETYNTVESVAVTDNATVDLLRKFSHQYPGVKIVGSAVAKKAFQHVLPNLVIDLDDLLSYLA